MRNELSLKRTLLYSSASAGLNIMGITVSTWLLYFYSPPPDSGRHVYLPIALVGVLMTISSLWDAIIDPFIGHWSDNLRSRLGRRRPFIIFAAPIASLSLIIIWIPPKGGSTAINAIFFFIIITIFYSAFSLVGIPYDGSMPEMASNPQDLITLSTWKNIFGILGVMIGVLAAAPLFESIGPLAMGIVVGTAGLFAIWLTLTGLKETNKPIGAPLPVMEGMKDTLKNKHFLRMFYSVLLVHISYAMVMANLPYFVTVILSESESVVGTFQGILVVLMLISAPLWNFLSKKYANRNLLKVSMYGLALILAINYFAGYMPGLSPIIQGMITVGLLGPLLGGYFILAYAMMGSIVDYDELFTKSRREGIYYGAFSLGASIGPSIAAMVLPLLLGHFGYSMQNSLGIRIAWLVAAFFSLIGAIVFIGYGLGDTINETIKNLKLSSNVLPKE
jgi:GPH family glycoside/pentoside/hexuronide:cation symporter